MIRAALANTRTKVELCNQYWYVGQTVMTFMINVLFTNKKCLAKCQNSLSQQC